MRNEGGYAQIFFPDGKRESVADLNGTKVRLTGPLFESSTFTCVHCNSVVHVPPRADVNFVGMCRSCMKPVCQKCSGQPCRPWEEAMQRSEARGLARRSYEDAK